MNEAEIKIHCHDEYIVEDYIYNIDKNMMEKYALEFLGSVSNLNLEKLTDIYFTSNYLDDIAKFNNNHGLNLEVTQNEYGTGSAYVAGYLKNGEVKSVAFFNSSISFLFYSIYAHPGAIEAKICNNVLNCRSNELVDIHDENIFLKHAMHLDNESMNIYRSAFNLWAEYYAHLEAGIKYPYTNFENIKSNLIQNINLLNMGENIPSGVLMICRNIGDLHSINKSTLDIGDLDNFYHDLDKVLKTLVNKYPNWEDIKQLDELIVLLNSKF